MGVITKGEITLTNVNDAYTVSLTNSSCIINANFDGSNPDLSNAQTIVTITKGGRAVDFMCRLLEGGRVGFQSNQISSTGSDFAPSWTIVITGGLVGDLGDYTEFELVTEDGFVTIVRFAYTVVREAGMLDWIKEWDSNKTKIGDDSIITPRLFVGTKWTGTYSQITDVPQLTGVYIGPDASGAGVYAYKNSEEIFHLNETGGLIGGWEINNGGIQTQDGALKILSEGSIVSSASNGNVIWGLYKNGQSIFANGNVVFNADGSASYAGRIESSSGLIGGWYISEGTLRSYYMCLDSVNNHFGVSAHGATPVNAWDATTHSYWIQRYGGVKVYWANSTDYGLEGYLPMEEEDGANAQLRRVFKLGNENHIAGWNFDDSAIWMGEKNNTIHNFTVSTGDITLGTNGLRGYKWYLDSNGDVSFMGGKIKFTAIDDGGEIVGWKLNTNRFSTDRVALISDGDYTGLYLSANPDANFHAKPSSDLETFIDENGGGIYLNVNSTGAEMAAYNAASKKVFKIKTDSTCSIAGWSFDSNSLFTGTKTVTGFAGSGDMTLGPAGFRGYKWRFENDGSGALAGDKIYWNAAGELVISEKAQFGIGDKNVTIIKDGTINAELLNVTNILATGQIQAKQVLSPFVYIDLSNTNDVCGFNISNAYNSFFHSATNQKFIFLPCDIEHSGRTITLHYAQTDNYCSPISIFCKTKEARFLQLYHQQTTVGEQCIRVIQLTAGCTIQLIAIPHRADHELKQNFVDWYLIGCEDPFNQTQMVMQTDELWSDELWTEYYNTINNNIILGDA